MKIEIEVPDDIVAFMKSDQMNPVEFFDSIWTIARGTHGQNQIRGARRENFTAARLMSWDMVQEYKRGDEHEGACDHLIRHARLPHFWIRIEEKAATWQAYEKPYLARQYPQGHVTFNLYKSRLPYADPTKYYPRHDNEKVKAFHIATGTYVKDGVCRNVAARVSQLSEHPKHPGRLYHGVNVKLDAPNGWADLFDVVERFVDEQLEAQSRFKEPVVLLEEHARPQQRDDD